MLNHELFVYLASSLVHLQNQHKQNARKARHKRLTIETTYKSVMKPLICDIEKKNCESF
jgi:hypothetical protein